MGISTDGQLCYGIIFEEGFVFPWDENKKSDEGIEEWWLYTVLKYKPSFEIYDEDGLYLNKIEPSEDRINQYYQEKEDFIENNKKLPVKLVLHCSYDYPMYILSIPESFRRATRGEPEEIDLGELEGLEEKKQNLINFCKEYDIRYDQDPCWILSSMWDKK